LVKNANTTCLIGRALGRDLSAALRRAVRLANDANCFAISEAADGAAAGARTVFGVIIGTGTGGGLCVDGRCLEGANGIAGEWGHNPVPWRGRALSQRPCYCGRADCIETYLCGSGLLRTYHEREPSATAAHVQDIVARARGGDATARGVLDAYAEEFAQCLATVVNVFDPEVVVLGGGLSNLPDLAANVAARLPAHVFSPTVRTRVVRAVHGDSSGVRGAAWLWSVAEARAASSLAD
jgi:fructokinase